MIQPAERVRAWRPRLPGVQEVLHARFVEHCYPMHTHDSWTLLIVDSGAVRYDLDRAEHVITGDAVALLPPHVPHNGNAATRTGFRKRVLYLEPDRLDPGLVGHAVDRPVLADGMLHRAVRRLHDALSQDDTDPLDAEARLVSVSDRIRDDLLDEDASTPPRAPHLAGLFRDLLEARYREGVSLAEASTLLHAHPSHLVRVFTGEYGMSPHQYLVTRRVDRARRLILAGRTLREAAAECGFHDQPHLSRHFKRILGVSPGAFAVSAGAAPSRADA